MQQKQSLWVAFCALLVDVIGLGIIIPILPKLIESFSESTVFAAEFYGFLTAVYALMQFLFAPVIGALSDRFGRRPVLILSLLGLGADYFIMAFAPSLGWFVVARILSGMLGASYSAAMSYIADISTPENRTKNFGLIGVAFGLGFIAGPLIGGVLGHHVSLRAPFLLAGTLAIVNALAMFFWLKESLPEEKRRKVVFSQLNPIGVLIKIRDFGGVNTLLTGYWFASLAHRMLEIFWVVYMGYRFQWDTLSLALSLTAFGVATAVVQGGLLRFLSKHFGDRRLIYWGLSLEVLSFILFGIAPQGWMIFLIIPLAALGGVAEPAIQSTLSGKVGERYQGALQGVMASLTSVSGVLAPIIAMSLFIHFSDNQKSWFFPGAPFVLGAFFYLLCLLLVVVYEKSRYNPN
jgi:DHA1 family tetracycline resistance protein-like MFS transporter